MSFPIFDVLSKRADIGPERVAMQDLVTGEVVSYRQLEMRAARSARLLNSFGVAPGDRVALLCRNRVEFFEILFACAKLGVILVPLNWRMPAREMEPLLRDCGAELLIHGVEDSPVAQQLSGSGMRLLDLDDDGSHGFKAHRDTCDPLTGRTVWPDDETWYLLYTSGTTGKPKAVIQTFGMAMANYINITQAMGLRGDDTTLNFLPLFHTGGINLVALPALMMGARVLVSHGFDLELTVDLLKSGELDNFFGVPAIYQAISLHPDFAQLDLTGVRSWACGGAPMPEVLLKRFAERGATVLNGMGMTETGPTVFLMDETNAAAKIGSVGKPQLLASVRIVGPDGKDVSNGETGELWFSGPGITPGYFRRPKATAEALPDGRWLRSGDLARRDGDGYYFIEGRLKDMYISGGENVYPAEVENQLAEHPDILEAAVLGIPDDKWGEVGLAYILPRPGRQLPDAGVLKSFLRQHLAAYKIPVRFVPVPDFPRTAAGKVQKHLLPAPGPET